MSEPALSSRSKHVDFQARTFDRETTGEPSPWDREPRILVGGSYWSVWFFLAPFLSVITFFGAAKLWNAARPVGVLLAVVGSVLLFSFPAMIIAMRWRRRWLIDHENGFTIIDRRGRRIYRDEEVIGLAIDQSVNDGGSRSKKVNRTLTLRLDGDQEHEQLVLKTCLKPHEIDPLGPLIARLYSSLVERARVALVRQQPLEGAGWVWQRDELRTLPPYDESSVRINELAAVEVVEDRLCLWKRGEIKPFARLPVTADNVWLLDLLLQERIPDSIENDIEDANGLGRLLLQWNTSRSTFFLLVSAGGLLLMTAVALGITAVAAGKVGLAIAGAVIGVVGLPMLAIGWLVRNGSFRCHEFGVHKVGPFRGRSLRFDELESFTYREAAQSSHGIKVDTMIEIVLEPREESPNSAITYTASAKTSLDGMRQLRDRAAGYLAKRMAADLSTSGAVGWTPQLRLRKDGVLFFRKGLLRMSKSPEFIPFDSITGFAVRDDYFHIWTNYQERAVLNAGTADPNFFAGLLLLERIMATREAHGPRPVGMS